jgi:cell division protein FtsQ
LPELSARVATFLSTLPGIAAGFGRRADALESADLRHKDGYAVKLRGVTTGLPPKHNKNAL